jgi:serine/threonine-protein kinase HipA
MRKVKVFMHGIYAGILEEIERGRKYKFKYNSKYSGEPISLTMPAEKKEYDFDLFPPLFDGLLPEGVMLEALLRQNKIDKDDYLSQIIAVGSDLVGAVTVKASE